MSFYPTFARFPRIAGYGRPLRPSGHPQGGKTPNPPPAAADEGYWLGCFASDYVCRPCGGLEKPSSSFQRQQPSKPLRKFFILRSPGGKGGGAASAIPLPLLLIFRRRIQTGSRLFWPISESSSIVCVQQPR